MPSVLSEQEYNQVYRMLSSHQANNEDIIAAIKRSALPQLKATQSFLDIGPGTGYITQAIRPHFQTGCIVEPSTEFSNYFAGLGYETQAAAFQQASLPGTYDYVLCSHVLYNVDLDEWPAFLDKMLGCIKSGGVGTVVMSAARGNHHAMCATLNASHKTSAPVIRYLEERNINHRVDQATSVYPVSNFDDMYTLCRFALLEDCFTPEKYMQLSLHDQQQLDEKIRQYAQQQLRDGGSYRLDAEVDYVHIFAA